jgi:NTE family protein
MFRRPTKAVEIRLPWILAAALVAASPALAQEPAPPSPAKADVAGNTQLPCRARPSEPADRPRIGLVLGGGGARGIAHISVLRTIEELGVPVDCIAGTSMGALVGALYASGMSVDEIETLVTTMEWDRLFNDKLDRRERTYRRKRDDDLVLSQPGIGIGPDGIKVAPGLLAGQRITLYFESLVEPVGSIEDFDQLPIPFRAIAADVNSGEAVAMASGDLATAMRASMSIPGAFPPVSWGGRVLVDGGVASNLPVQAARDMGADIVIAVDVGTPLATLDSQSGLLAVADQLAGLLTVGNTRASIALLGEQDVLVRPQLDGMVATADFDKAADAMRIGEEAMLPLRPRLAALGLPAADYRDHLAARVGRASEPPTVAFVRIRNDSPYSDKFIQDRIDVPLGEPLDAKALDRQLYSIFGLETLSSATYQVLRDGNQEGIEVHLVQKSQGPTYIETGLSMSSDLEGGFDFSLRLGLLRSPFNESGGEWRAYAQVGDESQLLAEVYQPLGSGSGYFVSARTQFIDSRIYQYDDDGGKIGEYNVQRGGLQLTAGKEISNHGAVSLGYRRFVGETESELNASTVPSLDFDSGEAFADITLDRLDSAFFPRSGHFLRTRYLVSRDGLGADEEFDQLDVDGLVARRFDKHSLQLGMRYHSTVSGVPPIQSLYRLGGFSRLVGFRPNELTGSDYALVLAGYNYQIGNVLNQPALVGAQLEYGNAWQSKSDISFSDAITNGSVYIGIDSWIGPVLFGIGFREQGQRTLFLEVGNRF